MIEFCNVSFKYDKKSDYVLQDISLTIPTSEFIAIAGKNGAGKTTLIKHLNGLLKPTIGDVLIDGESIVKTPVSKLAIKIGLAFQNPNHQLFAETVKKELEFCPKNLGLDKEYYEDKSLAIAEQFNIEHLLEKNPLELSGGERRLVSIASVLTANQEILVLDEPTYGQDYRQKKRLGEHLSELVKKGITVIIVSHDIDFIMEYATRIIILANGQILADGSTFELLKNHKLIETADLDSPILLDLNQKIQDNVPNFPSAFSNEIIIDNLAKLLTNEKKDEVFK